MEQQKEYRSIVKATALFGGVQAFQVLLTLVRTKVVALLLGVDGVGLLGMFNNAISMVQSITGLGINQGGVKSLSSAEDPRKAAQIATLIRQMSLYAGLLGAVVVLALSPWLSQWSFGTRDFTGAYMWLACTILFGTSQSTGCICRTSYFTTYLLYMENGWRCGCYYTLFHLWLLCYTAVPRQTKSATFICSPGR